MACIVAQTEPTKLVLAFCAPHVVTAASFVYRNAAFRIWTFLCPQVGSYGVLKGRQTPISFLVFIPPLELAHITTQGLLTGPQFARIYESYILTPLRWTRPQVELIPSVVLKLKVVYQVHIYFDTIVEVVSAPLGNPAIKSLLYLVKICYGAQIWLAINLAQ